MPFQTSQDEQGCIQLKVNNIYFELFDKYFDSFAVSFACNVTYIFGSVVTNSISLTVRLGCLWNNLAMGVKNTGCTIA